MPKELKSKLPTTAKTSISAAYVDLGDFWIELSEDFACMIGIFWSESSEDFACML
jgi:hypothetical protein